MKQPEFFDDHTINLLTHSEKLIERSKNIIKKMDDCIKMLSSLDRDFTLLTGKQDFLEKTDTKKES